MNRTDELRARYGEHTPNSAREVMVAHVGADPYEGIRKLETVGEERAKWAGVAYELEQGRKSLLARLATEIATAHADQHLSEAKLERMARADPRYEAHIKRTADAVHERERLAGEYWAIRSELEWDRAALAHTNALSRLGEPA